MSQAAASYSEGSSPRKYCAECGGSYPPSELSSFGTALICRNCEPRYLQRMSAVTTLPITTLAGIHFAGFWIRALAIVIDSLIVGVISSLLLSPLLFLGLLPALPSSDEPASSGLLASLSYLLLIPLIFFLVFGYHTWFVHRKGGTPGKLLLGLKIVKADGGDLSFGLATGRYFASMISGFILNIGFLIAAFDSEKRALHDHICSTRVIYHKSR